MATPIHREATTLARAPALITFRGDRVAAVSSGTVLVYHGLGASKETNIEELESLAENGFVAVGIDAVGHGDRAWDDFDDRFDGPADEVERSFVRVVRESAEEVPALLDALRARGLLRAGKGIAGIAGISMGAYIAYAALPDEKRLGCAVAISGSPEWKIDGDASPIARADRFPPAALLSQIGARDPVVDPRGARDLHRKLAPFYAAQSERIALVEYPEGDHLLANEWSEVWRRTLEWFARFLASAP